MPSKKDHRKKAGESQESRHKPENPASTPTRPLALDIDSEAAVQTPLSSGAAPAGGVKYTHSLARALLLADKDQTIEETDFTRYGISPERRRLDSLARLLRIKTTVCAAVAIDPRPEVGNIIVAINGIMDEPARSNILGLIRALVHLARLSHPHDPMDSLTEEEQNALYKLADQKQVHDFILRIVDRVGTEDDLRELKEYYTDLQDKLEKQKGAGTLKDEGERKLEFAKKSLLLFASRPRDFMIKISENETIETEYSRYSAFLKDSVTLIVAERAPIAIAKLAQELDVSGKMSEILSKGVVILSSPQAEGVIHAEMQIAEHFLSQRVQLPEYIGVSMHCCRTCSVCMNVLYDGKEISYRGETPRNFPNVSLPPLVSERINAADIDVTKLGRIMPDVSQEQQKSDSEPSESHMEVTREKAHVVPHFVEALKRSRSKSPELSQPKRRVVATKAPAGESAARAAGTKRTY